jgi:hypothetical protein
METIFGFATMTVATLFALLAAFGLNWLLLRTAFVLMQPATVHRIPASPALESGVRLAARAYANFGNH